VWVCIAAYRPKAEQDSMITKTVLAQILITKIKQHAAALSQGNRRDTACFSFALCYVYIVIVVMLPIEANEDI